LKTRSGAAGALALAGVFLVAHGAPSYGQSNCSVLTPCILAPASSMPSGNLYMSGSHSYVGQDSGIAAAAVSTIGFISSNQNNFPIPSTARTVAVASGATPGVWSLPAASTVPAGQAIQIIDPNGYVSGTNTLAFVPAANTNDTINGQPAGVLPPTVRWRNALVTAVRDGQSDWTITISVMPTRSYDFQRDFGAVPATALGLASCQYNNEGQCTTGCEFSAGSWTVNCGSNIPFSQADVNDRVWAQYLGPGFSGYSSTISTVTPTAGGWTLTLDPNQPPPQYGNQDASNNPLQVIYQFTVVPNNQNEKTSSGLGYKFGSTQDFAIAEGTVVQATASPALMTVANVTSWSGGDGSNQTKTCEAELAPLAGYSSELANAQAIFSVSLQNGSINSVGLFNKTSGGDYTAFSGYPYGDDGTSHGVYKQVPIQPIKNTGCDNLSGTINFQFGVVLEVLTPGTGLYTVLPCSNGSPTFIQSNDSGSNLEVECNANAALATIAHDNQTALENAIAFESAQSQADTPACITVEGMFLTSGIPVSSSPLNGFGCWRGQANYQSGFYFMPGTGSTPTQVRDILPIVDANPNGGNGPTGLQITDPKNGNQAGTFIENLLFVGDNTSPTTDNAITFYGGTRWAAIQHVSGFNLNGHLLGVGADGGNSGDFGESALLDLRTEHVGGLNNPAIGLDGVGGVGANNLAVWRYRAYQDYGVALAIRTCVTSGGSGNTPNGPHQIRVNDLKVESSGLSNRANPATQVQIGEYNCPFIHWPKSDGSTIISSNPANSGGGIELDGLGLANTALGTKGIWVEGDSNSTQSQIYVQGTISGPSTYGVGVQVDTCTAACTFDLQQNGAIDYDLVTAASPNVTSGSVEYDGHGAPLTTNIGSGVTVMATMRCALGSLSGCYGANGALVDQNSAQAVTGKTIDASPLGSATPSSVNATTYSVNGVAGVTCSGRPGTSFVVTNGIVTHC